MKDIAWTLMLAVVLLLAVTLTRHGLIKTGAKGQQVASLNIPSVAPATINQASRSRTTVKSGAEQRAGEGRNLMASTAAKHEAIHLDENQSGSSVQGTPAPSRGISKKRHQAPAKPFLAQLTPEAINHFQQAQNKVSSGWDGHGGILGGTDEIDTTALFHRLQDITEPR